MSSRWTTPQTQHQGPFISKKDCPTYTNKEASATARKQSTLEKSEQAPKKHSPHTEIENPEIVIIETKSNKKPAQNHGTEIPEPLPTQKSNANQQEPSGDVVGRSPPTQQFATLGDYNDSSKTDTELKILHAVGKIINSMDHKYY